jgi:hypothetical protein
MDNLNFFTAQIDKWTQANVADAAAGQVPRKVVVQALYKLVNYSPVDTGYLRKNWLVTAGAPAMRRIGVYSKTRQHPEWQGASVPLSTITGKVPTQAAFPRGEIVYISNSAKHAVKANNGTDNFQGNPYQMLERTKNDLETNL